MTTFDGIPTLRWSPWIACLLLTVSAGAEKDPVASGEGWVERFKNTGVLAGWTGANQAGKVTESTAWDHDGNGRSLMCLMKRDETDTPSGGCHAEMHLDTFPDGKPVGQNPGFSLFTSHWVKFDVNCSGLDVGFWQLKNSKGPEKWKYLAALWRESSGGGDDIVFEVNPAGVDYNIHARLSRDGIAPMKPGSWHHVEVAGCYTEDKNSWVRVRINGKPVTWYADKEGKKPIGTIWRGQALPVLKNAGWQFQVGAYGFFKKDGVTQGTAWIDRVLVKTPLVRQK
jgi:hypothetical protein